MAPRRRAVVTQYINPSEQELMLQLALTPTDLPSNRMLRGRLVSESGKPLAGAVVIPKGAQTASRRWWGPLPGVDAASVTDEEGYFVVTSLEPMLGLNLRVEAPGYAIYPGKLLALSGELHEIRLQRGATVYGRLVWEGEPVPHRVLTIAQQSRAATRFVGEVTLATDVNGQFLFPNLQPNEPYVLKTLCSGTDDAPVLKSRKIETGANSTDLDLGDLALMRGLTLAGRIELPVGATLPAGAKLRIFRDTAWDSCALPIERDGSFAVRGLSPEVLSVSVTAPGFTFDFSRLRFQSLGENRLALRLSGDRNDLVIPMRADRQP